MKRKFLFAVIPALLVLSSCGVKPSAKIEPNFFEDTLAHEEVFAQDEPGLINQLVRKAVDPVVDPSAPSIGVQSHVNQDNSISIRFVGAVTLTEGNEASVSAVWTRTMYNALGDAAKGTAQKPCKTAYTVLKDGDSTLSIQEFNAFRSTTYTHFVVYTMLNIPSTYSSWYLNAFLTVDGVSSKAVSTTVDQSVQTAFDSSYTYFLRGTIGGVQQDLPMDKELAGANANDHASFSISLKKNDSFKLVVSTPSQYKIFNDTYDRLLEGSLTNWKNYYFVGNNGGIKINYDADYIFYLNDEDYFYFGVDNVVRPIYVSLEYVNTWWSNDRGATAIYAFNSSTKESVWLDVETSGNYLATKVDVDPSEYDKIDVVRYDSNYSIPLNSTWTGKYNQTNDATVPTNGINDCIRVWDDEENGNKKFDWIVRS